MICVTSECHTRWIRLNCTVTHLYKIKLFSYPRMRLSLLTSLYRIMYNDNSITMIDMAPSHRNGKLCVNLHMHMPAFVYLRRYVWNTVNESGRHENFLAPHCIRNKMYRIVSKQGKYMVCKSFHRPSNIAEIGSPSSICRPAWSWNLVDDPKNNRKPFTCS